MEINRRPEDGVGEVDEVLTQHCWVNKGRFWLKSRLSYRGWRLNFIQTERSRSVSWLRCSRSVTIKQFAVKDLMKTMNARDCDDAIQNSRSLNKLDVWQGELMQTVKGEVQGRASAKSLNTHAWTQCRIIHRIIHWMHQESFTLLSLSNGP